MFRCAQERDSKYEWRIEPTKNKMQSKQRNESKSKNGQKYLVWRQKMKRSKSMRINATQQTDSMLTSLN